MMECPPRAQSVMTVESRTSSFFNKTFSKLRRKKGSVSSVRNSTTNNPYNVGMSTPEPYFGKRFMSQPLLSLGVRDSTSSTGTAERERRSCDVLGSQMAVEIAPATAPAQATPTAQTTALTASSMVPPTAASLAHPPVPDATPSTLTNGAPRTAAPSVPNAASRPSRTSGKHGPSHSITAALVAGTGVGVAVVDGLPIQGDAGAFVFPPSSSQYSVPRPSTAIPAPVVSTPNASKTLPRPSTSSSSAIRPHPSFVRMPSSVSPYATARLSPTLITRAPMPIINLPPLPSMATSSATGSTIRGSGLRSMPALPRQGTMDENDNDGDSDSSDSDGEGEDDGFLDANDGEVESEEGPPEAGGNRTPRVGVRQVELPPLNLGSNGWGNLMSGGLVETPDHVQTPTDYFSTSSRISGASIRTPGSSSIRQAQTPRIPPTPSLSSIRPQTPGTGRVAPAPSSIWIPQTPGTGRIPPTPASSILIPQTPVSAKQHGIYKHASRSMINILGPAMTRREEEEEEQQQQPGTSTTTAPTPVIAQPQPAPPTRRPSVLDRRRSMPTFTVPGSPPPPYPAFAPHWRGGLGVAVEPPDIDAIHRHHRDHPHDSDDDDDGIIEEARYPEETGHFVDMLPSYTNDIYLRAIMPRKMEFSAPGVQAKDRKWRRVVCELEGTVLRVFEDVSASSGIGAWWERRVGVGDVASSGSAITAAPRSSNAGSGTAQNGNAAEGRENEPKSGEVGVGGSGQTELTLPPPSSPPQPSPPQTRSIIGRILTHGRSWSDAPSPTSPTAPTQPGRTSLNIPDEGGGRRDGRSRFGSTLNVSRPHATSTSSAPSVTSSSPHSHSSSPSIASSATSTCGDGLKLLHAYTLQHAESGLGNDYLKRKNVIRVRMEGEQFLLQAGDVKSVVEWIEGLHAAANVALDLDERPMPRGPLFPRRRRRRRPAQASTSNAEGGNGGS